MFSNLIYLYLTFYTVGFNFFFGLTYNEKMSKLPRIHLFNLNKLMYALDHSCSNTMLSYFCANVCSNSARIPVVANW
jgi:hypothetical protein